MIPIVSVVGKSDSGKTTLLEKLVKELTSRGYRIGTIKHDVHSFEIDHPGKDSWRHKQAGASATVISSPAKLALVVDTDHDHTLAEIRDRFIQGVGKPSLVDIIHGQRFRFLAGKIHQDRLGRS